MSPRSILVALAAVALLALTASAFPGDLNGMPNGQSYGITLGHPNGNKKQTTGIARGYYGAGQRWSQAFCQADSDGDGQSNGLEMGDPCCVWTQGATPMFTTGLSNPNSAASTTANEMPNCAAAAAEFQAAAQRTSAVRPMQFVAAQPQQPCDACVAKIVAEGEVSAEDAAKVCELQLLQCGFVRTAETCRLLLCVAPAAPTVAPKVALAVAAKVPCDKCIAEITEKGADADDAAFVCQKVLKCQAAVAPVAMWSSFSNFATLAAGVPFADCSAAGHTLQVTAVALNPSPPQKGQNVAISISGNLAAAVGSATAQLTVSLGAFQVLAQTFQLPAAAAGPVTQTVNLVVPGFAPSGTYTAKGVITSGGQQLACITANFNL